LAFGDQFGDLRSLSVKERPTCCKNLSAFIVREFVAMLRQSGNQRNGEVTNLENAKSDRMMFSVKPVNQRFASDSFAA